MEIKTKYNIGDKVWFMSSIKAHCEKISRISIDIVYHAQDLKTINTTYYLLGYACRFIGRELFPTKEELLKSL